MRADAPTPFRRGRARRRPAARRVRRRLVQQQEQRSGGTGGTYRVGWENSFGFTDNFDPTGEYLGDAQSIQSSLLVRTLVGYDHVAGVAGNKLVPDLATDVPEPTDNGLTYTFKLKNGITFGPPLNRPITSADVRYAMERLAVPKNGGQYAFYYSVIKGFDDFGARQGEDDLGHRDARRQDDRLPPDQADRRLPLPHGHAGDGPDPRGGREVLRGQARPVRQRPRVERAVHDRGRRRRERLVVLDDQADERLRPDAAHARPQPELQRELRLEGRAREPARPLRLDGRTRTPTTSSARCRRASSRTRCRASRRPCCAST